MLHHPTVDKLSDYWQCSHPVLDNVIHPCYVNAVYFGQKNISVNYTQALGRFLWESNCVITNE